MGLIIAAVITTLLAATLYGYLIRRIAAPEDRRVVLVAALIMLPMQPLAFYLVRMPIHHALEAWLGHGPALTTISLFYAPLTEEPAKWLVLLIPYVRRRLTAENAVAIALATGVGFGIGEIWFVADQVIRSPAVAALPFYMFGGLLSERFMVCFLHGAYLTFAFKRLADGRSFLVGGLIGMALHFVLNFPIFLMAIDLGGIGREAWGLVLQTYMFIYTIAVAVAVNRVSRDRLRGSILGNATRSMSAACWASIS
jgi:RsiW-degrading membrane proteinase PrsW (M82 family)